MATGRVPTTANSPLTAKGDLFTYSTAPARLAVGLDGEQIVADSSTSTGLRWQVPVQANPVINSAMQIAQRGTSIAVGAGAVYTLDRWMGFRSGAVTGETVSRQATSDTTNLPFIQYCARVQRDSGNTSTANVSFSQSFESINSIPFAGKTVTLSFYARKGSNFSATSDIVYSSVYTGTGTDQTWVSGYTGFASAISQTNTVTTTWQKFTMTGSLGSTITELAINFSFNPTGTASTNDYFEVTGVQLEVGSVATPFHTLGGTIQGELAACQRYYYRNTALANYGIVAPYAFSATTNNVTINFFTPVPMRTISSIDTANLLFQSAAGTTILCTSLAMDAQTISPTTVSIFGTATGAATSTIGRILANNTTNAYIGVSGEL